MTVMNNLDYDENEPVATLDHYQQVATGTAVYPGQGSPLGVVYCALKMNGEAGEFAEHVGKAMRDDGFGDAVPSVPAADPFVLHNGLTPGRRELLLKELGDVLWYVSAACNELGASLSDVANINLKKLADRKARGQLRGSGDRR